MSPTTEVRDVDPSRPDSASIEAAAGVLRSGGLVAFPTETVYGLGADAMAPAALRRVFEAKGRPATDPLIVHVSDVESLGVGTASAVVAAWPDHASELAERFWPGPLTMILARSACVPGEVTAGLDSVAVRVPSHPVARALLDSFGGPVAAPSANRFGRISPTTGDDVLDELDGRFDLLLEGGPTPLGVESTVVDLTGPVPTLLRPGGVTLEDLQQVLGEVAHEPRHTVDEGDAAVGPGQFLRHYAPVTPVVLVEGGPAISSELVALLAEHGVSAAPLMLPDDPDAAARALYTTLRAADRADAELLLAPVVAPAGLGRAVNDRLFRAAHGRVVSDAGPATIERLVRLVRPARTDGT